MSEKISLDSSVIGFHVRVFQKTCTSFQENMYMFF